MRITPIVVIHQGLELTGLGAAVVKNGYQLAEVSLVVALLFPSLAIVYHGIGPLPRTPKVTGSCVVEVSTSHWIPNQVTLNNLFPDSDCTLPIPIAVTATTEGIDPQFNCRRTVKIVEHFKGQAATVLGSPGPKLTEKTDRPIPTLKVFFTGESPCLLKGLCRFHLLVLAG